MWSKAVTVPKIQFIDNRLREMGKFINALKSFRAISRVNFELKNKVSEISSVSIDPDNGGRGDV
jgi:hypothetical protein